MITKPWTIYGYFPSRTGRVCMGQYATRGDCEIVAQRLKRWLSGNVQIVVVWIPPSELQLVQ